MITNLLNNPRNQLIAFLLVFLACFLLLMGRLFATGSAIGGDAVYYFATLRSLSIDLDLDLKNEYEYFHNQTSDFTGNRKLPKIPDQNPVTAKLPTKYPIGSAIFLMPFFFLASFLVIILKTFSFNLQPDGYNILYQFFSALGSLIYAFAGVLLLYKLGGKIFGIKVAFWGTLFIWLATPLIYYMTMEPLNSQPLSFFMVSLFIYFWVSTRTNRKISSWIILGFLGGAMSMVRYQDSLFMLIPIIDVLISSFLKKSLLFICLLLLSALGVLSLQGWANNYLFGSPFTTGYTGIGFPYLTSPKIFYSLLSWERGLLVWSPILIFSLLGMYWFIKKSKLIGGLLLLSFLAQLYIVSSWADPSQGDSFGNRILLNSSVIFALGLMQFLKNTQDYQKLFLTIFTLLILINGVLASLYILRIIGQPY